MRWFILLCVVLLSSGSGHAQPILGADLSFVPRMEHLGVRYRQYGVTADALSIFRANNYSRIRLRLWHTPDEPWNGLDSTIAYAQRAVAAGFEFLLDIHYSDSWADPSQQTKPSAWQSLPFSALEDSVYAYTNAVIRRFRTAGALPSAVQIGNEISGGFLWNDGRVGGSWDTDSQWLQLSELLSTAIAAVRDSLPQSDWPKIIIHIAEGGSNTTCRWFFDHLTARHVPFDIIGVSYYPWWHGTLNDLRGNLNDLAGRYGKEVQVMETAYPWTLSWNDSVSNIVGSAGQLLPQYGATPLGQANFLRDLYSVVEQVPNHLGTGLYYWEPGWVAVSGFGCAWENLALFDFSDDGLPALCILASDVSEHHNIFVHTGCVIDGVYPNPFNSAATIAFTVATSGDFRVVVSDILGRTVMDIVSDRFSAGSHQLSFDARALASGEYFVYVQTDRGWSNVKTISLIR